MVPGCFELEYPFVGETIGENARTLLVPAKKHVSFSGSYPFVRVHIFCLMLS